MLLRHPSRTERPVTTVTTTIGTGQPRMPSYWSGQPTSAPELARIRARQQCSCHLRWARQQRIPCNSKGFRWWAYTDLNRGPLPCRSDPPPFPPNVDEQQRAESLANKAIVGSRSRTRTVANEHELEIAREIRAMDQC